MNPALMLSEPSRESDQHLIATLQTRVSQLESLLFPPTSIPYDPYLLDPALSWCWQSPTQLLCASNSFTSYSYLPLSSDEDESQSDGSSVELNLSVNFEPLASDVSFGSCPYDIPFNLLEPPQVFTPFEPDTLFPILPPFPVADKEPTPPKFAWDNASISKIELQPWSDEEVLQLSNSHSRSPTSVA